VMGTCHGIEILPVVCPDIARATAADIADFANSWPVSHPAQRRRARGGQRL